MRIVISVKRSARDVAPDDWAEEVCAMEGVSAATGPLSGRITCEVSEAALEALRARFGDVLHLEPILRHDPSGPEPGG